MFFERVESGVKSIRPPQTILCEQDLDAKACSFELYGEDNLCGLQEC